MPDEQEQAPLAAALSIPTSVVRTPTLPGPEPISPQLLPIRAIHRHEDGVVTFHRKNAAGEFENLFAVRAADLKDMFPQFREQLERDSFFSLNAFWSPERHRKLNAGVVRQPDRLRYLCSNYADLDIYKLGVEFGVALGAVISYQDAGLIPPASVIARSGRGLWLFWFLHDPYEPAIPQRAFSDRIRLYWAVNRAIGERLVQLGADAAARDALRLTRVPGSVHSGATGPHKRVKYWLQCGDDGQPITYTLRELADVFHVGLHTDAATRDAFAEANKPTGARRTGQSQLIARRLRELAVLREMRGGFAEGVRHHAILLHASLFHKSGMDRKSVLAQVISLARECRPPLECSYCRTTVKSVFNRHVKGIHDQLISDWLDITPGEAEFLEKLGPASRFRLPEMPIIAPPLKAEARRALIEKVVAANGMMSCRRMAAVLASEGHPVSFQQVHLDYRALGLGQTKGVHAYQQVDLFCDGGLTAETCRLNKNDLTPGTTPGRTGVKSCV